MIEHPPITGRRDLDGELAQIHRDLMRTIVRFDMLGEDEAAALLVEVVETLVDAPRASERPREENEAMSRARTAYGIAIERARV